MENVGWNRRFVSNCRIMTSLYLLLFLPILYTNWWERFILVCECHFEIQICFFLFLIFFSINNSRRVQVSWFNRRRRWCRRWQGTIVLESLYTETQKYICLSINKKCKTVLDHCSFEWWLLFLFVSIWWRWRWQWLMEVRFDDFNIYKIYINMELAAISLPVSFIHSFIHLLIEPSSFANNGWMRLRIMRWWTK